MKFDAVAQFVSGVPFMSIKEGYMLYHFLLKNDIETVLELGTGYGTGACYMAAALKEKGKGNLTTIDKKGSLKRRINIQLLVKETQLEEFAKPVFANTSYNWELMKLVEAQTNNGICNPLFDFCYLDGAHNFEIDTAAFFLIDKLLKPGGRILFDDLNWTYSSSKSLSNSAKVRKMTVDEKTTPHVKKIVDLFVTTHPNYYNFETIDNWFVATKKENNPNETSNYIPLKDYAPSEEELTRLMKIKPSIEFKPDTKFSKLAKRFANKLS